MIDQLINLLTLRNELTAQIATLVPTEETDEKIRCLITLQENYNTLSYYETIVESINKLNLIKEQNKNIVDSIQNLINKIGQDIDSIGFQITSANDYTSKFNYDSAQYKRIWTDTADLTFIKTRIGASSNWKYPGIIVYPKSKCIVDSVVASDPLYLVYAEFERIQLLISKYNVEYQRRLRLYNFNAQEFFNLPSNQASVVVCWELFNFLSLDLIKETISKVYNWLRPGGVLFASYSNCDLIETASTLKFNDISYCNPRLITQIAVDAGFEVDLHDIKTNNRNLPSYISWAELRKPGTLSTVKAHQALGEIVKK
jgi:hypothetical protein